MSEPKYGYNSLVVFRDMDPKDKSTFHKVFIVEHVNHIRYWSTYYKYTYDIRYVDPDRLWYKSMKDVEENKLRFATKDDIRYERLFKLYDEHHNLFYFLTKNFKKFKDEPPDRVHLAYYNSLGLTKINFEKMLLDFGSEKMKYMFEQFCPDDKFKYAYYEFITDMEKRLQGN